MVVPWPGERSGSLPSSSAADRVYLETKELILSGDVPAGRLLSEGDIAQRMSSVAPGPGAFVRLQSEDLLELIPKRGAVVTPVPTSERWTCWRPAPLWRSPPSAG